MKIDKALSHFEWRLVNKDEKGKVIGLKNNIKPSLTDVEALNSIIQWKELQESVVMSNNESLAKLWIHQLILFTRTGVYSGERSIQVLDEILNKTVYDWCIQLKEEIPMMRFGHVGSIKYPLEPKDYYNMTKLQERRDNIIRDFETELTEAMKHEVSEENIIKFVKRQINRIINKYEK